jgi:hypothetical protein
MERPQGSIRAHYAHLVRGETPRWTLRHTQRLRVLPSFAMTHACCHQCGPKSGASAAVSKLLPESKQSGLYGHSTCPCAGLISSGETVEFH